jgi:hypothetical protein
MKPVLIGIAAIASLVATSASAADSSQASHQGARDRGSGLDRILYRHQRRL